jgi:hypothetical protein
MAPRLSEWKVTRFAPNASTVFAYSLVKIAQGKQQIRVHFHTASGAE